MKAPYGGEEDMLNVSDYMQVQPHPMKNAVVSLRQQLGGMSGRLWM